MKKLSFLTLAAAGLLLGACSSEDDVVSVSQVDQEFQDGAFIGMSLQLPSADNTTRANDELSNGTEAEFAVKNATLYIFKLKTSETGKTPDKDATFVAYVPLGKNYTADDKGGINPDKWGKQEGLSDTPGGETNAGTKITSTYSEAAQIPNALASQIKSDEENDYYAYVIVNHNGQVPAVSDGSNGGTATTFETFSKAQFDEIGADIAAKANIKEGGLLMTSSPVSDKAGGKAAPVDGVKYSTLVKLDKSKIFGSKAEAEKNPAGCVYIERAAVKVTVVDSRGSSPDQINSKDVTIVGWQIINYEPTYYNTRQIESVWGGYTNADKAAGYNKYRFVSLWQFVPTLPAGTQDNPQTHTDGYRTYFAKDVQYDDNATLRKTVAVDDDDEWIAAGEQNHAYTTENTFDVAHQTWRNTTMVTLKARIGEDGFYTVGKGSQVMYTSADDAKAEIQNIVKNDPTVAKKYNDLLEKISENNPGKTVQAGLTVNFTTPTKGTTGVAFTVGLAYTIKEGTKDPVAATYSGTGEAALKTELETAIENVILVDDDDDDTTDKVQTDAVLLSYYKDGYSFYNIRIKHFGDEETPWSATGSYIFGGGTNITEIYGTTNATENFLGRYGVVRDNWYKLSVNKIGKIGTAEPVDPSITTPDTPDDEIENYISVHVHIVPWVLRSQGVEL